MDPAVRLVVLFLSLVVGGVLLEVGLIKLHLAVAGTPHKEYHYSHGRYLFFLLFPLTAVAIVTATVGSELATVFLIFALIGTALEWLIGYASHQVLGARLWTYHRYALTTYTSLLSIPLWGLAGVLFWLLARALP